MKNFFCELVSKLCTKSKPYHQDVAPEDIKKAKNYDLRAKKIMNELKSLKKEFPQRYEEILSTQVG